MEVKKAKKVIARPVQVNSSQTSSATTTVRTAVAVTRPTFIGIKDVQRLYLPMLSLKKIGKIVTLHVHIPFSHLLLKYFLKSVFDVIILGSRSMKKAIQFDWIAFYI